MNGTDEQPSGHTSDIGALRARMAPGRLDRVASKYSDAYGHPAGTELCEPEQVRIGIRWRAVVAGGVILLLLVGTVLWRTLSAGPGEIVPLSSLELANGGEAGAGEATREQGGSETGDSKPGRQPGTGAVEPDRLGASEGAEPVLVHVAGQVGKPGVVELADGMRILDAIDAAGGATGKADLTQVNLARKVVDGEQILVPAQGESLVPSADAVASGGSEAGGGPVNINSADAAGFESLPGIGPVLAERIVMHREKNGQFTSVDQLADVSGIGPSILGQIRDLVTV